MRFKVREGEEFVADGQLVRGGDEVELSERVGRELRFKVDPVPEDADPEEVPDEDEADELDAEADAAHDEPPTEAPGDPAPPPAKKKVPRAPG